MEIAPTKVQSGHGFDQARLRVDLKSKASSPQPGGQLLSGPNQLIEIILPGYHSLPPVVVVFVLVKRKTAACNQGGGWVNVPPNKWLKKKVNLPRRRYWVRRSHHNMNYV